MAGLEAVQTNRVGSDFLTFSDQVCDHSDTLCLLVVHFLRLLTKQKTRRWRWFGLNTQRTRSVFASRLNLFDFNLSHRLNKALLPLWCLVRRAAIKSLALLPPRVFMPFSNCQLTTTGQRNLKCDSERSKVSRTHESYGLQSLHPVAALPVCQITSLPVRLLHFLSVSLPSSLLLLNHSRTFCCL